MPWKASSVMEERLRFVARSGWGSHDRQKLGIKEVDDGIWLVSFMHYDLGCFDLEQKTMQPLNNPFGTRLSPMS
jgi:hypothetical protein